MTIDNNKTLDEILENEEVLAKLADAHSDEEILTILRGEGVEMSIEELQEAKKEGRKMLEETGYMNADGELTEKALEAVAGGRNWRVIRAGIVIAGASAAIGFGPGVALGAFLIIAGWKY